MREQKVKSMPLNWLTLHVDLKKWELIPKKEGLFSWRDYRYRSLAVNMYFLCFKLVFLFTYNTNNKLNN